MTLTGDAPGVHRRNRTVRAGSGHPGAERGGPVGIELEFPAPCAQLSVFGVGRKVAAFAEKHPDVELTRLGIGDVTLPLASPVVQALHRAADDGPAGNPSRLWAGTGYPFARRAVGTSTPAGRTGGGRETLSDGAKSDLGGWMDLFGPDNVARVPDPGYPVYGDISLMAGHPVRFVQGTRENGFARPGRTGRGSSTCAARAIPPGRCTPGRS